MSNQFGQYINVAGVCAVACFATIFGRAAVGQELQYPVSVVVDAEQAIYVADQELPGIWKIKDGVFEKFFEASNKYRTPLNAIRCLAWDAQGRLLAGDSGMREVFRFDADGKPVPLTGGKIGMPMAMAVRENGEILVSDLELHCIWKIPADGGEPSKLADVQAPIGICLGKDDQLWVVSRRATALLRIGLDGKVEELLTDRPFNFPNQIAVDDQDTLWITDGYAHAIWKVGSDLKPQKVASGEPLMNPNGITRMGQDFLIADPKAKTILRLSADGTVTPAFTK